MESLKQLREALDVTDNHISRIGWDKASHLVKSYRHWLIEAIQYIQLKHWHENTTS